MSKYPKSRSSKKNKVKWDHTKLCVSNTVVNIAKAGVFWFDNDTNELSILLKERSFCFKNVKPFDMSDYSFYLKTTTHLSFITFRNDLYNILINLDMFQYSEICETSEGEFAVVVHFGKFKHAIKTDNEKSAKKLQQLFVSNK